MSRAVVTGQRAFYTGRENILQAFESLRGNSPFYSLWYGRDILFQYAHDDMTEGIKALDQILLAAEMQQNTDILTIKFHPKLEKNGYITDKTPVIGTLPVRVADFPENVSVSGFAADSQGMLAPPVYHMLKGITDAVTKNQSDTLLLMEKIVNMDAPAPEPEKDIFDKISGILEKPGIVDMLGAVLSKVFAQPLQPNLQVSGVEPEIEIKEEIKPVNQNMVNSIQSTEQVQQEKTDSQDIDSILNQMNDDDYYSVCDSLQKLSKHCSIVESLEKLAKYAETEPATFKMVLSTIN